MDFLEFWWDSRVTTGNSGFLIKIIYEAHMCLWMEEKLKDKKE